MENKLPEGWEWKKLGEIAVVEKKVILPEDIKGTYQKYIGLENIEKDTGRLTDFSETPGDEIKSNKYRFTAENILYGKLRPYLNKVFLPDFEGICSTDILTIKTVKGKAIREYVALLMRQPFFVSYANTRSSGANLPRINESKLLECKIPVPPLETQQKIVSILEKAEETKKLRAQADELTQKFLQSVFLAMFGDHVENPYGFEIGEIGDLIIATQYGTSKKANEDGKGIPVLRMNNITYEGNWDLSSLKYIELDQKEIEKYLVYKGELLFNRTNSKELVGKSAVYKEEEPMAFAGYLIKLITESPATSEFIAGHLNSKYGKMYLENMAKNIVGMANINAQEVQRIPILLPSREIMEKYSRIVKQIEKTKQSQNQSSLEINNLFDALMQKAFTGELVA